ncbi:MAG: radical SAM family heme chaperone HemW [Clostridia bacterium]|nr:radical SAM family heme chaperone HemW [Clostridia bacterium]
MKKNKATAGLYLHIPFCLQKCLYCDFCSFAGQDGDTHARYVERLCREIVDRAVSVGQLTFDTVYFGGGTPTLLSPDLLGRVLDTARTHLCILPDAEVTVECNPATADAAKLSLLREAGVNRLSIGLQSADDGELRALGRAHTAKAAIETVRAARQAGFGNLSLDVMLGIPHQTRDSLDRTLDTLLSLSPEHISAYSLILEEGTPFYDARDTLPLPDEDTVVALTEQAFATLAGAGYARYEISNFARAGFESRHNLHYWRMDDYLGVGIAAHSLIGRERLQNRPDLAAYLDGEDITEREELLSDEVARDEYVMLGLRLVEGIDKREFRERFGLEFDALYPAIKGYARMGLMLDTPDRAAFTDKGFAVSNAVLAEMLFN